MDFYRYDFLKKKLWFKNEVAIASSMNMLNVETRIPPGPNLDGMRPGANHQGAPLSLIHFVFSFTFQMSTSSISPFCSSHNSVIILINSAIIAKIESSLIFLSAWRSSKKKHVVTTHRLFADFTPILKTIVFLSTYLDDRCIHWLKPRTIVAVTKIYGNFNQRPDENGFCVCCSSHQWGITMVENIFRILIATSDKVSNFGVPEFYKININIIQCIMHERKLG